MRLKTKMFVHCTQILDGFLFEFGCLNYKLTSYMNGTNYDHMFWLKFSITLIFKLLESTFFIYNFSLLDVNHMATSTEDNVFEGMQDETEDDDGVSICSFLHYHCNCFLL